MVAEQKMKTWVMQVYNLGGRQLRPCHLQLHVVGDYMCICICVTVLAKVSTGYS